MDSTSKGILTERLSAGVSSYPSVPFWERFQCMGLYRQDSSASKQTNYIKKIVALYEFILGFSNRLN